MLSFHVKFVQTDKTDNSKTMCPRSFDAGGIRTWDLYKTIPVIKLEGQNSWSQDNVLNN